MTFPTNFPVHELNELSLASLKNFQAKIHSELALAEAPVFSSFGLWVLLASYGNDLKLEKDRTRLSEVLGADLSLLQHEARRLLTHVPAAVAAATGAWGKKPMNHLKTQFDPLMPQKDFDAWARENTFGLMNSFPTLPLDVEAVLASALAVKVGWVKELGLDEDENILFTPGDYNKLGVYETEAAGLVAALAPTTHSGVEVLSVSAAPETPPEAVWAAVAEIVEKRFLGTLKPVELYTPGHSWTVKEETVEVYDTITSLKYGHVKPWNAEATFDLTHAPGVQEFAGDFELNCIQQALGAYTATGFTAAAVTAMMFRAANFAPQHRVRKTIPVIDFHFTRAHAVTAYPTSGLWTGIRLFDSWVTY